MWPILQKITQPHNIEFFLNHQMYIPLKKTMKTEYPLSELMCHVTFFLTSKINVRTHHFQKNNWFTSNSLYRAFRGSLITNPESNFQNSRWRINMANPIFKTHPFYPRFGTKGFRGSLIKNSGSTWQNSRW